MCIYIYIYICIRITELDLVLPILGRRGRRREHRVLLGGVLPRAALERQRDQGLRTKVDVDHQALKGHGREQGFPHHGLRERLRLADAHAVPEEADLSFIIRMVSVFYYYYYYFDDYDYY